MEEFVKVLRENPDKAYDWVCDNYTNLSKMEMADMIKELLYEVHVMDRNAALDQEIFLSEVADELEDRM